MQIFVLLALLLLPSIPTAHANGDCSSWGLGIVAIGPGTAGSTTIYVDDRGYALGYGVWVYEESNGEDGLQRGGSSPYIPNDNEICIDDSANGPDALVF